MDPGSLPPITTLAVAGVVAGLFLLARGLGGFRTATRIGDTGTSKISSLAAGEVRVSGVIEAAELTLVSPLQSEPCVFYRSTVEDGDDGPDLGGFEEERAIGFRVRDATGSVRIFPRGARWDAPLRFDDRSGLMGDEPPGLELRVGGAIGMTEVDREAAIAALLSVRPDVRAADASFMQGGFGLGSMRRGPRRYREARLGPGDAVTIIGRALPFADLSDPAEADIALGSEVSADDTEVAADLAEAREAGLLADTPEEAWGNAAIPGLGIGRPVRAPTLDPAARSLPLAATEEAARTERRFTIAPETLVIASGSEVPLLIAHGLPDVAVGRHQDQVLLGLLGAVLAIGSALALAWIVSGWIGS